MEFITEKARDVQVEGSYDVVVVGGGIAGIAAALAAKRTGAKKVLLIDKMYMLGGLATLGLITIYLPICDGMGHQVSYGISEELLHLSMKYGWEDRYPGPWLNGGSFEEKQQTRFQVRYNPNVFAVCVEQLLIDEGVELLYGTSVCECVKENDRITHLIIENKSGRSAIGVKSVVDSSGDADICKLAGEQTKLFSLGNRITGWYYSFTEGEIKLHMLGLAGLPKDGEKTYDGIDARATTKLVCDSHALTLNDYFKEGMNVNEKHSLTMMATIPQLRMTRRLVSDYDLDYKEDKVHFTDSIGLICDWRKRGPVFEVPYRTLYALKTKNLIASGRCISVTDDMWEVSRVIPPCAITGQAAGTAAAMTDDFKGLDISVLQQKLVADGVKLFVSDVL